MGHLEKEASRQQKRRKEQEAFKAYEQLKKQMNVPATRREVLNVAENLGKLTLALDALLEVLCREKVVGKESIQEMMVSMSNIHKEASWVRKLELCDEYGIDKSALIEDIKKKPSLVSPEEFEVIKAKYFPEEV